MQHADSGRGEVATADMKARIAAIQAETWDMTVLIDRLWERNRKAVVEGAGYTYDFAPPRPDPVRPTG